MSRSKPKPRAKAAKPNTPAKPSLLLSARFWSFMAVIGVCGAAAYGLHVVEQRTADLDVQPTRIEWVDAPEWLSQPQWKYVLDDIEQGRHLLPTEPLLYSDTDIRDRNVCAFVYESVRASAWVQDVDHVSKLRDGRVRVHATFRKPFAAVEKSGMAFLVDELGVRLPVEWRAEFPGEAPWLRIRGARGGIPAPGQKFEGHDFEAGLTLVRFLYRNNEREPIPFLNELLAVDVSDYDEKLERLRIITINPRSYICWGHRPGQGYGVEATAEEKLATLTQLYKNWGRLPDEGPFSVQDAPKVTFALVERG